MKKLFIACVILFASCTANAEGDFSPFVMFDVNSERDAKHDDLARDYIGANLTVGVKTPNKIEYTIKGGVSRKDESGTQSINNNIEVKIKKSYKLTDTISPYVALRLGEKIGKDANHFAHYAIDGGVKFKLLDNLAFDTGLRYRNALDNEAYQKAFSRTYTYESIRLHGMLLFDLDKTNTIGLRYSQSTADDYYEERKSWRLHYQHNY
jgi:opacity protein-like surface antigen